MARALKCLDHLEKFSKATAETPFNHSQAKTLCIEAYKWVMHQKGYLVSPSFHMPFTLCTSFDSCDCCPLMKISHMFANLQERQANAAAATTKTMPQPQQQAPQPQQQVLQPALVTTTPHPQQQIFLRQQVLQLAIFASAPQPAAVTAAAEA